MLQSPTEPERLQRQLVWKGRGQADALWAARAEQDCRDLPGVACLAVTCWCRPKATTSSRGGSQGTRPLVAYQLRPFGSSTTRQSKPYSLLEA